MKNENIIIALIFLAIVALFAFNFNKLTGFTAAEEIDKYAPIINLYKTDVYGNKARAGVLNAGEKIDIEIKIKEGDINPEFKVYSVRNGIVGTRKKVIYFSPDIGDCARISSKGAKIPCGSSNYAKGKLVDDLIKKTFKTDSDWKGNYILRVYYFNEKNKETFKDSEEFIIS